MKLRAQIKEQAKKNFTAPYWMCVGAFVLYMLIVGAASGITFGIGAFFLAPPMIVGFYSFSIKVYRGQEANIEGMFSDGFSDYWRNVGGVLWMYLFTFLVDTAVHYPGNHQSAGIFYDSVYTGRFEKCCTDSGSYAFYEDDKRPQRKDIRYDAKLYRLGDTDGSYGGILAIFWTGPYMQTSFAGMYDELKKNALETGIVTEQELA